jgi:tRNA(Arg) A34 adenosine deaminase TadA
MNPWKYFELAAKTATLKEDERTHRHGAVGLRSDGVLVTAANGPAKMVQPKAHAEARLCRKIDTAATVFVVRVSNSGYSMSRPCKRCATQLRARRVARVFYTVNDTEYGVLNLR